MTEPTKCPKCESAKKSLRLCVCLGCMAASRYEPFNGYPPPQLDCDHSWHSAPQEDQPKPAIEPSVAPGSAEKFAVAPMRSVEKFDRTWKNPGLWQNYEFRLAFAEAYAAPELNGLREQLSLTESMLRAKDIIAADVIGKCQKAQAEVEALRKEMADFKDMHDATLAAHVGVIERLRAALGSGPERGGGNVQK